MSAVPPTSNTTRSVLGIIPTTLPGDVVYEQDYIINIGDYSITYCIQMKFQGYKLGECIGIKSLMPGQQITQTNTASYSKIVYDETGKQIAIADTTTSESEFLSNVSNTLQNISQTSTTNTTSNNWNASGGFGLDLGICSFGGGGGGGGSSQDVSAHLNDMMSSIITASTSMVKNNKSTSNLSSFNSLRTTTETQSTTNSTSDTIRNLSTTNIAMYYFHTMYKRYDCDYFIKNISQNPFITYIPRLHPALHKRFMSHLNNQKSTLDTLDKVSKMSPQIIPFAFSPLVSTGLIGTNGLIGEGGLSDNNTLPISTGGNIFGTK